MCGALRLAGAVELLRWAADTQLAIHFVVRNAGARAGRVVAEDCSFGVRLYGSAAEITRGAPPVWADPPVATGPDSSPAVPECDLMDLSLTVPPNATRSRVARSVALELLEGALPAGRYVVALTYRTAVDGPVQLVRAGCVVLDRRRGGAVSLRGPGCTEWRPAALAAELDRVARARAAPGGPGGAYFEFQVDRLAAPLPTNAPVRRLAGRRAAGVTDTVVVQFVVDTAGRVRPETLRVLAAHSPAAAEAVRASVPAWRFTRAERKGRPVSQVVQMVMPVAP